MPSLARLAPARVVARPTLCVKSRRGVTGVSIDDATGGTRPAICFPTGPIPVGPRVRFPIAPNRAVGPGGGTAAVTTVDAFGVSAEQWELIEGNLFGASLLPYLVFLYYPRCRRAKRDAAEGAVWVQVPPRVRVWDHSVRYLRCWCTTTYSTWTGSTDPRSPCSPSTISPSSFGLREGLRDVKGSDGGKRSKVSSERRAPAGARRPPRRRSRRSRRERAGALGTSRRRQSRRRPLPRRGRRGGCFFRHAEPRQRAIAAHLGHSRL